MSGIVHNVEPRGFGRLGHLVLGVASSEMVLGKLPRCLKVFERVKIALCHSLFLFVVPEMGWEGLNGIKVRGATARAPRPQPGPANIRNKQEEPLSV